MKYATISDDDGIDYRRISKEMTSRGWKMNHSSARNYILRIMQKFAVEYAVCANKKLKKEDAYEIAKDPLFQSIVSDMIQKICIEDSNENNN